MKRTVFAYPYIVWMLIFILAPMLLIIWYAFSKDGSFTLANLTTALKDPIYMQVLLRSVWIAFKATVICLLLGYPIAWFLSTMRKSTAAILYILFIVPMWMNFLLRTYAWQAILDSAGILNVILEFFGLPPQHLLYTEGAIMLGTVYNFLPFMILPIYSVLIKLDKSLVEAAYDLGCTPWMALQKVVIPDIMPGIVSGFILAFTLSLDDFVVSWFATSGIQNLSIYIYSIARRGISPKINALSTLMFVAVIALLLIVNLRSLKEEREAEKAAAKRL